MRRRGGAPFVRCLGAAGQECAAAGGADAYAGCAFSHRQRTQRTDACGSGPGRTVVADWRKARRGGGGTPPVFRLFGYAGTGKTTLARHIADGVDGEVKFAAFTGKAALVMRNKGCDNASTIHSLIYRAKESGVEQPSFELWDDAPASKAKLTVIDECWMRDSNLHTNPVCSQLPLF